jgi:putative ABC transport system permease protein
VLNIGEIPAEISASAGGINIIVPQLDALIYAWYVNSADPAGFAVYAREMLHDMIVFDRELGGLSVSNIRAEATAMNDIGRIVMIFVYGFITMLTLIGLTNVISTVSTNIYARSREFAMLKSIGMDSRGLRRILNLESVFCTVKAVVVGLPIGLLASWLIHDAMADVVAFPFEIPWVIVAQCVIGVFVITWCVTMVSARKLRGQNIIDTIRGAE